jgi:hypothetical protein
MSYHWLPLEHVFGHSRVPRRKSSAGSLVDDLSSAERLHNPVKEQRKLEKAYWLKSSTSLEVVLHEQM